MDNHEPEVASSETNPDVKETIANRPKANANAHDAKHNIIVIKRVKKHVHKHHGGSWKIAYADFVTAMMTFFLLMWLLSMLNKYQLQGISEYFKKPISEKSIQSTDDKKDKVDTGVTKTTDTLKAVNPKTKPSDSKEAKDNKDKGRAESEKIKQDLESQLKANPKVSEFANSLNFVVLSQGLKIELKDLQNQTMFSSGKTDFGDYAKEILNWLAPMMNKYPNRVMIIGHTDSKPFGGNPEYTNWELSADRANATRRELIKHGMAPDKIVRIVGMADVDKLETAADSLDPKNRRIAIIVLTEDAYQKMLAE